MATINRIQPDTTVPYVPLIKLAKSVNNVVPDEITGNINLNAGNSAKFGIEDNTGIQNRNMNMGEFNINIYGEADTTNSIQIYSGNEAGTKYTGISTSCNNSNNPSIGTTIYAIDEGGSSVNIQMSEEELIIEQSEGNIQIPNLQNAVDDTAAALLNVKINGLYRNGSILMIRVS